MSSTFERANKLIEGLVQKAIESYHPALTKEGVTVDCIIARRTVSVGADDTEERHCLKRNGYPIDAKIQVTSLVDRARGIADAKLTIDGYEWNHATDRQRLALIDHELEHLDLVPLKPTKKEPNLTGNKRDDLNRPMLKVRPHDWMLAGFKTVAERHGEHSHEALQCRNFRYEYAQLNFFGPPDLLAIANGTKEKKSKGRKVLHTFDDGKSTISRGLDLSNACARRHHAQCKYDKCECENCNCATTKKENRANA
jgi:hypothetical protein